MKKFAACVATLAALAFASPAAADYGDWSHQRDVTRNSAYTAMSWQNGWALAYTTSGVYSEHSRYLRWSWWQYFPDGKNRVCHYDFRIDHNYGVFNVVQAYPCYQP